MMEVTESVALDRNSGVACSVMVVNGWMDDGCLKITEKNIQIHLQGQHKTNPSHFTSIQAANIL